MSLQLLRGKLALGTVQLGLPYGINNKDGKPSQDESARILDTASKLHINMLDSAESYGDSLRVIGQYLSEHPTAKFDIISKFIESDQPLLEKFSATIESLNTKELYSFMYHRFSDYRLGKSKAALLLLKEKALIRKIGISVYSIDELSLAIDDPQIDLIQLPFNPFDRSKEKISLLKIAKSKGKEIHIRSIFLQGLFFKIPQELTGNLVKLTEPLRQFHEIIEKHNLNVTQGCLNYALHNPLVDKVIIGVEKSAQLEQNLEAILKDFPVNAIGELDSILIPDQTLLNPSNWKP